jgi:hypothetical protein
MHLKASFSLPAIRRTASQRKKRSVRSQKEKNQASRRNPSSIERNASDTAAAATAERSQIVALALTTFRKQRELRVFPGSLKVLRINHDNSLPSSSSTSAPL